MVRARSNSTPSNETPSSRTVTLRTAANEAQPGTLTVSAAHIRGKTQLTAAQKPTIYLDMGGGRTAHVTQQHGDPNNVGVHHSPPREDFFGNVASSLIDAAFDNPRTNHQYVAAAVAEHRRLQGGPHYPAGPQQLLEMHSDPVTGLGTVHESRSRFESITGTAERNATLRSLSNSRDSVIISKGGAKTI